MNNIASKAPNSDDFITLMFMKFPDYKGEYSQNNIAAKLYPGNK